MIGGRRRSRRTESGKPDWKNGQDGGPAKDNKEVVLKEAAGSADWTTATDSREAKHKDQIQSLA